MKNLKIVLMSLGIAVMSIMTIQAQPQRNNKSGEKHPDPAERMMQRLDLTEDQKTQIDQLHLSMQKDILPIENQIDEKAAKLKTLMSGGVSNQNEIFSLIEEMGLLEVSMKKQKVSTRLAVRELLTEDQQVKFDQMPHHPGERGKGRSGGRQGQ